MKECRGCYTDKYETCFLRQINRKKECVCQECLVKVTCKYRCEERQKQYREIKTCKLVEGNL
jgi:hypothetical protein